jgi:hypothetical protein
MASYASCKWLFFGLFIQFAPVSKDVLMRPSVAVREHVAPHLGRKFGKI